ncbi:YfgM family protein [Pseudoalteromonas sp. MTN2-4]|uniref:YfgM family protein n=1 Tax=Pseudoalteromonas sp. MTN2-4 TaxID=3056555 RepID=UPI0036F1D71B
MEIYSTEEQQAEAIKRFFRENGVSLALGIVIGLGGLYGWKYYNQSKITSAEAASNAYNELVEGGEVLIKSDSFIAENGDSNYAALAAFVAAKEAVEKGEFETAVTKLTWLQDNVQNPELKATAILRLARVQAQLTQYDAALKTLSQTTPEAFKAQVAEVKGDVYLAKGDKDSARSEYEAALAESTEGNNSLLQIKLDNLATAQPAA